MGTATGTASPVCLAVLALGLIGAPRTQACDGIEVGELAIDATPGTYTQNDGIAIAADAFHLRVGTNPPTSPQPGSWADGGQLAVLREEVDGDLVRFTLGAGADDLLLDPHLDHACGVLEGRLGFAEPPALVARIGARTATLAGVARVLDTGDPHQQHPLFYRANVGDPVPFLLTLELAGGSTWQPGIFASESIDYVVRALFRFAPIPVASPSGVDFGILGTSTAGFFRSLGGTSADASVIAGSITTGIYGDIPRAVRWDGTAATVLPLPPGARYAIASGVSGDGQVLVGTATPSGAGTATAVRWVGSQPQLIRGGYTGSSAANDASFDGAVIVGHAWNEATLWRAALETHLGRLPGGTWSDARAVSADGTTVVGFGDSAAAPQGEYEAFVWTAETGMVGLGALAGGDGASLASDVSADGRVVVGASSSSAGVPRAFRWTAETGMVDLCDLPVCQSSDWTEATGVSADGRIVVGVMSTEAFVWDAKHGFRLLTPLLGSAATGPPLFAPLWRPQGVSSDGLSVVGRNGVPWRARLVTDCANEIDDDGDGAIDAADGGCTGPGDRFERETVAGCDDGLDEDDGDGLADWADPDCAASGGAREQAACSDGIDNDGDGGIDSDGAGTGVPDLECAGNPLAHTERPRVGCGIGAELALALALLRARASRTRSSVSARRTCRSSSSSPIRVRGGTS